MVYRKPTGGSRVLAELIDKYGGALLPDLLHYFQVDLRDLFDDESGLTPRVALSLVLWLPTKSAYIAERRGGPQFRDWDTSTAAQAATVNALRTLQHSYVLTHIPRRASRPKPPTPFPLPQKVTARRGKSVHDPRSFAAIANSLIAASKTKESR